MGHPHTPHLPRSPSLLAATHSSQSSGAHFNPLKRPRSPNVRDDRSSAGAPAGGPEAGPGVTRQQSLLRDLYARSERMINALFLGGEDKEHTAKPSTSSDDDSQLPAPSRDGPAKPPPKRTARAMDEDDYGDDDEEDGEEESAVQPPSPSSLNDARRKLSRQATEAGSSSTDEMPQGPPRTAAPTSDPGKSSEEVRKKLEEEKKAAVEAAKESFQNLFYTLENDRDAMLEQQKLDELDRQVETEMSGQGQGASNGGNASGSGGQPGTLSSANLGASSLTLKHLIARIDQKRSMVKATDAQLRSLMSEVRKNRSKWASEERVGQEELYESAERVLMELKAMTEWAGPFLQKVNKRDAPDYYHIIKHPMDIGTMIKKLKQLQYESKKQFCDDLELIWSNCLKYNANPEHFLRKKAEHMRKETARLTPLIPDIVVRNRADVEAEERRLQHDFDDGEDSEDEPLMSTRGRKAPGKSSKKGTSTARKAQSSEEDANQQSAADGKPMNTSVSALSNLKNEHLRSDGDSHDESQHGLSTPPPGNLTPVVGSVPPPSNIDASELEGLEPQMNGVVSAPSEEVYQEAEDYQTWKQVTKKDRARIAAERHRLFQTNKINPEEPALLRTKGVMRRWLRQQKSKEDQQATIQDDEAANEKPVEEEDDRGTTLAEGMDVEDDSVLPDYYDPVAAVPQISERLAWIEDGEGQVADQKGECLRLVPEGQFIAPQSSLSTRIDSNMRQMQETRKIVAKISIVKQMQVQAQTYQNQFQKYDPEPFREADVGPLVVADDGPVMSQPACRQAMQRSISKVFYHAGFEDCQPSAIETITDLTSDYFSQMVQALKIFTETPKVYSEVAAEASSASKAPVPATDKPHLQPRFTPEEAVLQVLHQFSHDVDSLDTYVTDDVDRLASRLEGHHSRTRDYLAELLRPAIDPAQVGADGAGAFHDGSEQFVGGDFAEDIDEDFFGFKELGLDKEFGLASLSVPLHLLQSRMHNAYQPALVASSSSSGQLMEEPPRYPAVTIENVENQIGLVKEFFKRKLEANDEEPLIEDDDLPVKQRFPKPRLPPSGKISSPRKRPLREQQMMARKKRRMEIEAEREREREAANIASGGGEPSTENGTAAPAEKATSTSETPVLPSNGAGDTSKSGAEDKQPESNGDATGGVNGEPADPTLVANDDSTTAAALNGDVQVNGDNGDDVAAIQTDATSGLKIDLDPPPKQLQPTPATNGTNTGDPEKKKTPQPPDFSLINGDMTEPEQSSEDKEPENHQDGPDSGKDGKEKTNGDTQGSDMKPPGEESGKQDESADAEGDAEGDADADAEGEPDKKQEQSEKQDPDQDQDQEGDEQNRDREQNGMLSPESLPIAAH